jgi:hypothetical protein
VSNGLPVDTCLQCEQSRAEVKANETICGIEGGYEYVELVAEWPRHHWRDWSGKELPCIKPDLRDQYRRARLVDIEYAPCGDTTFGHNIPKADDPEWGIKAGHCIDCGQTQPAPELELADDYERNEH